MATSINCAFPEIWAFPETSINHRKQLPISDTEKQICWIRNEPILIIIKSMFIRVNASFTLLSQDKRDYVWRNYDWGWIDKIHK